MKKVKMFGFTLMLMFVCAFGADAMEISGKASDGKVSYTKDANENISYQVSRMAFDAWSDIKGDITTGVKELNSLANKAAKSGEDYEKAADTYGDDSNEALAALDIYKRDYQAVLDKLSGLGQHLATIAAPASNFTALTANSGEITLPAKVNDDDAYVIWYKDADLVNLDGGAATDTDGNEVYVFDVVTNDGVFDVNLDDEVSTPTIPDNSNNNVSSDKENVSTVSNPKTGVNMPIALGLSVIILAFISIAVIRKSKFIKNI